MGEHTGTHFDAPVHWISGKDLPNNACDTIPATRFIGPACVIDVTSDVARDPDFLLTVERLEAWEAAHGRIPSGAWVLLRTGWSLRADAASFINQRDDGPHSPGFDARASKVLAEDRGVLGVGVETIGTDAGQAGTFNPPFPNHRTMHGAGKFGLASLCNLDQLPPTGAVLIAAPLKIVNGSGSPLRVQLSRQPDDAGQLTSARVIRSVSRWAALPVILVIVLVLAAGLLRDWLRSRAVQRWD